MVKEVLKVYNESTPISLITKKRKKKKTTVNND